MKRSLIAMAAVTALALVGCGTTDASKPVNKDTSIPLPDAGASKAGYPSGPYGTGVGDVAENETFLGVVPDDYFCKKHIDRKVNVSKLRRLSFDMWYNLSKQKCATGKPIAKKLLWVMVSAGWCGPCQAEMRSASQAMGSGKWFPEVDVVSILFEDRNRQPATKSAILNHWMQFNPSKAIPIVLDPSFKMGKYFERSAVPFNLIVEAKTMKIILAKTGYAPATISAAIKNYLATHQ